MKMSIPFFKNHLRSTSISAIAIAALSVGMLPVLASSTNTAISGCVNATTGVLRIAAKCTSKEKVLRWNSVGPQGVPGPKGDQGTPGASANAAPTVQYKYELPERNLPMTSTTNTAGNQRDILLAVDTSKLPAGAYSIDVYLYGFYATTSGTAKHENVWCYLQTKSAYDLADFAHNRFGDYLDGDDWYDQDFYQDFVLHLSSAENLDANYGVVYLACRHNVALTGVYGFVSAHRYDRSASLPLA